MLVFAPTVWAQNYTYTARTQAPVLKSGDVRAGSLTWRCSGSACTITGPWPNPGVGACEQLAAEVGRITEYGHPGNRLDAAALTRCNRNAAQGIELVLQAPMDRIELPVPITRETIRFTPPPTRRFFAIHTGRGDGDFGGNGPNVEASVNLSRRGNCVMARYRMTATETRSDWTTGALDESEELWCAPDGSELLEIVTASSASGSYRDRDWEIDMVSPSAGEVDGRRAIPPSNGPVRTFMIMGDTNGQDVGPPNAEGRASLARTSLQVHYNPIEVVISARSPAPPAGPVGTREVRLERLHTDFFVPDHVAGDRDFFGNGPEVSVTSQLRVDGGSRLVAEYSMSAREVRGDTRASGSGSSTIWNAPPGWRITAVEVAYGASGNPNALGRRAEASFVDRDHETDFLVDGFGEAGRHPDAGRHLHPDAIDRRSSRRSHVHVFQVTGDTDGDESGRRTGMRVFFMPLNITLAPIDPTRVSATDFDSDVFLNVPTGDFVNRLSGGNSCGPQSGSRTLRFYGVDTTYEQFKHRVEGSGNLLADNNWGTPPGTLRDRMNDLQPGFVHQRLPLGDATKNRNAVNRIRQLLDQGKPVIVLVGWGADMLEDTHSPHDSAFTIHYVVVRGYNARNGVFHVVDNGHAVDWSGHYLETMMDYGVDAHMELVWDVFGNAEKGSIIYKG